MAKTIDGVNYGQGTFDTGMSLELMVTKYLGITLPDKKKLAKSYWESCLTGSLVTCTYQTSDVRKMIQIDCVIRCGKWLRRCVWQLQSPRRILQILYAGCQRRPPLPKRIARHSMARRWPKFLTQEATVTHTQIATWAVPTCWFSTQCLGIYLQEIKVDAVFRNICSLLCRLAKFSLVVCAIYVLVSNHLVDTY